MKKMYLLWQLSAAMIISVMMLTPAFSAGKGSNPNGKPFVELQGQIIEVEGEISSIQDQVDSIIGRVDTIEARVEASYVAIADLQAQNADLQASIDANANDIMSILTQIGDLEAANLALQEQINSNDGDIEALQTQIDENEAMIVALQISLSDLNENVVSILTQIGELEAANLALQEQIDSNEGNIQELQAQIDANQNSINDLQQMLNTIEVDLQAQISNNEQLIVFLQQDINDINALLEFKQTIISGNCPLGAAMRQINPDGSVVCEDIDGGGTGSLNSLWVWGYGGNIPNHSERDVYCNCPDGFVATSGLVWTYRGCYVLRSYPQDADTWATTLYNQSGSTVPAYAGARCIQLAY